MSIFLAVAYLISHVAAMALFPLHAQMVSFAFLVTAPLLAALACAWRARHRGTRDGWLALAFAMVLWAGGMATSMMEIGVNANAHALPGISMLLYVLYGVPLTFALASPDNEAWHLRVVDGVLALALGALFFVHTFTITTMSDAPEASLPTLRLMFDVENIFIAVFALLRYKASVSTPRTAFFATLLAFAFVYLLMAGYINHFEHDSSFGIPVDVLICVPFLLLAVLAYRMPVAAPARPPSAHLAQLVRLGSPLMLPVSVLLVSVFIVRSHPWLAVAGFATALLGYGLRSVLVQMRALEQNRKLDALARVDPLTGLANRRQFDEAVQHEWMRARRESHALALLIVDIDHFKRLNDAFGHQVGDVQLRAVAQALAGCVTRAGDLVARYGGEEFVVLLPACAMDGAMQMGERMRAAVESLRLQSPTEGEGVTVSIGVSAVDVVGSGDVAALLAATDAALYDAKHAGRNRVVWRAVMPGAERVTHA